MADFTRGVIAGFVAGIVYGIVSSTYSMMNTVIVQGAMMNLWGVIFVGLFTLVPASLVGLVFGIAYAASYNFLPGSTSVKKGMLFSVIFWLVCFVILGSAPFLISGFLPDWVDFVVNMVIVGFIFSLIWGSTLGWVWDRVGGQPTD